MTVLDSEPAITAAPPADRGGHRPNVRRRHVRVLITTLILIPISVAWLYPYLWTLSASLKSSTEIFASPSLLPATPIQWENFTRAWFTADIGRSLVNTVIISVFSVLIVVITTALMGYALGRYTFVGRRILIGLFAATVFIPEGYTIIPVFELVQWLRLDNSLWGVILAESGGAHVLFILLFAGYFSQIPRELEEAAIIDGAGFVRVFVNVMLPLARPVIATAVILQFMTSWNSFFLPLVLTLSKPELRPLGVQMLAFQGEFFSDWPGMAAASVISQIPIVVVFLLMQRHFIEGVAGAVKQ